MKYFKNPRDFIEFISYIRNFYKSIKEFNPKNLQGFFNI